jgi:hypothetical protein
MPTIKKMRMSSLSAEHPTMPRTNSSFVRFVIRFGVNYA